MRFNKITFTIITTAIVASLAGCGNSSVQDVSSAADTQAVESVDGADSSVEETEAIPTVTEEELVEYFISEKNITDVEIAKTVSADFEGDGSLGAFITVGSEDESGGIVGTIYYTDGEQIVELEHADNDMWWLTDGLLDLDGHYFFYANEYYVTEAPSRVYKVRNHELIETEISMLGCVYPPEEGNDFIINKGAYDLSFDKEMKMLLGHSWKDFYFTYDPDKDEFFEYAGVEVSRDEAEEFCGFDIFAEIEALGMVPDNAMYRANGILTVNYSVDEEYQIAYGNVNYDCTNKKYIDAMESGKDGIEGSSFGGTYPDALSGGCLGVITPDN